MKVFQALLAFTLALSAEAFFSKKPTAAKKAVKVIGAAPIPQGDTYGLATATHIPVTQYVAQNGPKI